MARSVRLVIVCEDHLHETFARAFLLRRGFARREMTFRSAPPGQGDAKQHVCDEVCRQLAALRRFPGERRGLVYLIDADNLTVEERKRRVNNACVQAQIDPPQESEPVFGFVPRWEIENWLACLRGEAVDEGNNQYDKYRGRESAVYPLAELLADKCDDQALPGAPPSLAAACADYPRFRLYIRSN